jgi:uncharacterized protein (TIGR02453 family)
MTFCGFQTSCAVRFLDELSRNNERAWFDGHRAEFESNLIEPAKAFVTALGPRLRELDPKVQAIPRLRGSIKPMERRLRFRKGEQLPYRDSLDLSFWSGRRRAWDNSGFFLRLTPVRLVLAAGMIEFQKDTLTRYREHVLDDQRGVPLAAIVDDLRADGYFVGGEHYKKTPRGVPADHPRAALFKHRGLFVTLDGEHPKELGTPGFVDFAFTHFARMAKLHAWLVPICR